jgi:hypothetical protein
MACEHGRDVAVKLVWLEDRVMIFLPSLGRHMKSFRITYRPVTLVIKYAQWRGRVDAIKIPHLA